MLPRVITSDHHIVEWNREAITKMFVKEAGLEQDEADGIAEDIEEIVSKLDLHDITSAVIRALCVSYCIQNDMENTMKRINRVGIPSFDLRGIIEGSEDHLNTNMQPNRETSHKLASDHIFSEFAMQELGHIALTHLSGDIHIHDREYFLDSPFCASHDGRFVFKYGLIPDGTGRNCSVASPAKRPEVAILHLVKVLGTSQTLCAGGQGLLHFLTFLSPYLEDLHYDDIKQLMQLFIYECNQMFCARGGQSVFSSVNLTPGVPNILKNVPVVYAGKVYDGKEAPLRTYGEFEREVRLAFKAIIDVARDGDANGKLFPFPKLEVGVERSFVDPDSWMEPFEDSPSYHDLYLNAFKLTAERGTPYFDNMLPAHRDSDNTMSCMQCCAFAFNDSSDNDSSFEDRLYFRHGWHFDLGGMQVVSMNLPRIAYQVDNFIQEDGSQNLPDLVALLRKYGDYAAEVFIMKRIAMEKVKHRMAFLTQEGIDRETGERSPPYRDLDNMVFELGIVGLNEAVQHLTGYQLHENSLAQRVGIRICLELKAICKEISDKYGIRVVLARTPAETTAQRFAMSDLLSKEYHDKALKVVKGDASKLDTGLRNLPVYYSNGFAPWVGADISLSERLRLEEPYWRIVDGGAICHIWLGEKDPDPEALMNWSIEFFRTTNIGYVAFTKDISQCAGCHHVMGGTKKVCDVCGCDDITWYSRITGYYSAVGGSKTGYHWNSGKVAEFMDRNRIDIA